MIEQTIQKKVMGVLRDGEWHTVGEVASELGVKKNATIRCILDTLVFANMLEQGWGTYKKQQAKFYKQVGG